MCICYILHWSTSYVWISYHLLSRLKWVSFFDFRFPLQQETTGEGGGRFYYCCCVFFCMSFRYGFVFIVCFSTIVILTVVQCIICLLYLAKKASNTRIVSLLNFRGAGFVFMFQSGGNWRLRLSNREWVNPFVFNSKVRLRYVSFALHEFSCGFSIIIGILILAFFFSLRRNWQT